MRCRLGELPGPVGSNGPAISTLRRIHRGDGRLGDVHAGWIRPEEWQPRGLGDRIALLRECHLHDVRSCLYRYAHLPSRGLRDCALPPPPAAAASRAARTRPGAATLRSSGWLRGVGIACRRGLARWRAGRRGGTLQREHLDALTVDVDLEILRLNIDRDLLVQVAR